MVKSDPDSTQQKNNLIALILKEMERQGKKVSNISAETGIPKMEPEQM